MLKVSSSATNKKLANSLTYDNDINDEDLEKYILISIAISVFGAMYLFSELTISVLPSVSDCPIKGLVKDLDIIATFICQQVPLFGCLAD